MTKSLFEDKNTIFIIDEASNLFKKRKEINEEIQMSGAFIIKGEDLISDIRLEFDVKHPLFNLYIDRLKKFVKECEDVHLLKSSSGI